MVISGLKEMVRAHSKKNVPLIGRIPLLNLLFANEKESTKQTDIVVLLTPQLPTITEKRPGPAWSEDAENILNQVTDPNMSLSDNQED